MSSCMFAMALGQSEADLRREDQRVVQEGCKHIITLSKEVTIHPPLCPPLPQPPPRRPTCTHWRCAA